jgi:hypothetical protein
MKIEENRDGSERETTLIINTGEGEDHDYNLNT